jgi:hypothetical protein
MDHFEDITLEFRPLETKIASLIGRVFGVDVANKSKKYPKFYVAMDLEKGWLAQLFIVGFWVEICVDYERYPIRCHFFMGFSHLIKDYPSLTTNKDWVAFFNSKGRLLGGTLIPSLKVDKVNDKTIEKA